MIEDDRQIGFLWDPPIATAAFVDWMEQQKDFREVPLQFSPHMRLFERVAQEH